MNHPPVDTTNDVIEGRYADPEDVFYLEWARETYKQSIPRLLDSLQRVITLATALLGGSILSGDTFVPGWFRFPAMFLFFFAIAAGFVGTLPYTDAVEINSPEAVRVFKKKVAEWRKNALWYAAGAFMLGLFVAALGSLLRAVNLA